MAATNCCWGGQSTPSLRSLPAVHCRRASQADRYARRVSAGFPSGQRGSAVNRLALPSQVRILPPPSTPGARASRLLAVDAYSASPTALRAGCRWLSAGLHNASAAEPVELSVLVHVDPAASSTRSQEHEDHDPIAGIEVLRNLDAP